MTSSLSAKDVMSHMTTRGMFFPKCDFGFESMFGENAIDRSAADAVRPRRSGWPWDKES
jgi:hypothetical protein